MDLLARYGSITMHTMSPHPVGPNLVIFSKYLKKIDRGPNFKAGSCLMTTVILHVTYVVTNRLTTGQSRHARSLNKETHWYCSQHRSGKAKVIIPIHVTLTPTLIPLHLKENKIIQTRYAASDYHCYIPSCDKVCHLTRTCSDFIEPRDRVLAIGEWKYLQNSELRTKKRQLIN